MYYTYAYLREDRTPYYIGKGKGDRIYSTSRRNNPPKDKSRIIYLKQNLTEEEAFRHEIYMIAVFGRKDLGTGILYNMTDGGEGSSGMVHSEEAKRKFRNPSEQTRRKISEAQKGKTVSEKTRKKISEAQKGNTNMLGKTFSEETKRKMSEAQKGRKWWNDGCGNRKFVLEYPGDGWILGGK
jgi:group I intron endonuclease